MRSVRFDWAEANALRRRAARFTETWTADGITIWSEDGEIIGTMRTPALARLASDAHNILMPTMNALVMLTKRIKDNAKQKEITDE